ncbi:MAG: outer membrane beta-barrel protein, partial [Cyclobacteriaceae bacterium]|nr:outer membrane beta-barrel protein [Cyclobacteriaceae bacterium]
TGGLNVAQLEFETEPFYQHLTGNFEVSRSPVVGVSFDILSPRLSERFSFHGDLLYVTSKYYSYTSYYDLYYNEINYVTIELEQLKVPIGFRYAFPKRAFSPYLNAGISSTIHLSSNSNWVQEVESIGGVVNIYEKEALTMRNNQFGLWGGFGIVKSIHNKFNAFFELRYEQTDGILPFSFGLQEYSSQISNFQILIGVRSK